VLGDEYEVSKIAHDEVRFIIGPDRPINGRDAGSAGRISKTGKSAGLKRYYQGIFRRI
jgi:hypothetical protein